MRAAEVASVILILLGLVAGSATLSFQGLSHDAALSPGEQRLAGQASVLAAVVTLALLVAGSAGLAGYLRRG